jgi:hypothetical protein
MAFEAETDDERGTDQQDAKGCMKHERRGMVCEGQDEDAGNQHGAHNYCSDERTVRDEEKRVPKRRTKCHDIPP